MAGYWPIAFLCVYGVYKHAKIELGQYPTILTSRLVDNPYQKLTNEYYHIFSPPDRKQSSFCFVSFLPLRAIASVSENGEIVRFPKIS